MKILYSGGGTMGSVSPLLAINKQLKDSKTLWLGTNSGPEKNVVEKEGIKFKAIASGKLRQYFDVQNFIDVINIIIGFFQALYYILKFKPDVILTAGSFVAVPVVWAGWFNNVPIIIHQQDIQIGLANKLMAPCAKKITVALEKSLKDFDKNKVKLVGNPVRTQSSDNREQENFKFKNELPTILIMGGGTGAQAINNLVWQSLDELTKFCNVIHITGKNKNNNELRITNNELQYKSFEFLNQQKLYQIYKQTDLVISRAGMSALTELAYFSKPTIIIPMPNSHQEKNAGYFSEKNAGIYLKQNELDKEKFVSEIDKILKDKDLQEKLRENINKIFVDYSGNKIIQEINKIKN